MTETCSWCARTHKPGPENCLSGVLLVCGGRRYGDGARVRAVLDRTAERVEILAVRHGDAFGADKLELRSGEEQLSRTLILDAIMGIQDGQNPRVIQAMLQNYLNQSKRNNGLE